MPCARHAGERQNERIRAQLGRHRPPHRRYRLTVTTDPESRRRFLSYWWLIRPFVAHIMPATVNKIKADAEAAAVKRPQ